MTIPAAPEAFPHRALDHDPDPPPGAKSANLGTACRCAIIHSMRGTSSDNHPHNCELCGVSTEERDLVHASKCALCRSCVTRGVEFTLVASREVRDGATTPGAYMECAGCGKSTPPALLFAPDGGRPDHGVCSKCLIEAYGLLTQLLELQGRRNALGRRADRIEPLLSKHFSGLDLTDVVTTARSFRLYLRPDLQRAIEASFSAIEAHCVGLRSERTHEVLSYAALLDTGHYAVSVAPLRFEEVDLGDGHSMRCPRDALWFFQVDGHPCALLITVAREFGKTLGIHIELCVPVGEWGEIFAKRYMQELATAAEQSASYRGKVLSLECQPHYNGMSAGSIIVHRLTQIGREDLILPEQTLSLLERNVFDFFAHRAELRKLGMPIKKGLLLYGPPGTGKTHTIRYLASRLNEHTTILITAEQVAVVQEYIALARLLSPSIVVIEDVDLIARSREDLDSPEQESLLNRLLNEMDGLGEEADILFILTTNRPEALERALSGRPGRIDQAIEFPLPDMTGRRRLVDLYRGGLQFEEPLLKRVVERTEGVSASFVKELTRRVAQYCLSRNGGHQATSEDVDQAINELLFSGGKLNAKLLGASEAAEG